MTKHFEIEIEKLKRKTIALCSMVEESLFLAVKAVLTYDSDLVRIVIEKDREVDRKEVELEEECLKILALYQPVANDLRFVVAVLKLNNDIERIGDLAVNIAHRARTIIELPKVAMRFDFADMADKVKVMLRKCIDALINKDSETAHQVLAADDAVDEQNRSMYRSIQEAMRENPEHLSAFISLILVSRHLERIADHVTNIAEDIVYMVEGSIVRHGRGQIT